MKNWRRYLPFGIFAVALAVTAMLTTNVKAQVDENTTIPERVYVGTIKIGGLDQEEAAKAVQEYVDKLSKARVKLTAGKNQVEVTPADLGLSWSNPDIIQEAVGLGKSGNLIVRYKAMKDLEHEDKVYTIAYSVDKKKAAAVLEQNAETLNTEAVDAGLTRENGGFVIIPGSQGVTVNIEESIKAIEEYFASDWDGKAVEIALSADVVEAKGTEEELSKVKDVLGSFNTNYGSSSAGRAKNVTNGANRINGSVIYPGDDFSVYEVVSPFNAENGYELAGSYENGTTVDTYGGGICQVSTTLYNAVIRAELEIVERFAHSMTVAYVDPSADAAIAGTYKDLKFKNNTDAPIYIEGYTSGMVLYFTVFGQETREAGREVVFESETTGTTNPGTEYRATGSPIGSFSRVQSSHVGKTARLWKIVKINGVEQSRDIFNNSTYKASPAIYNVGTASGSAEASNNMHAAIATQDEGTIHAAMNQWNAAAIEAMQQQEAEEGDPEGDGQEANDQEPDADSDNEEKTEEPEEEESKEEKPKKEKPKEEKPKKEEPKEEEPKQAEPAEEEPTEVDNNNNEASDGGDSGESSSEEE